MQKEIKRIKDIAFRYVESELGGNYYEIVKWFNSKTCYTIIQCAKSSEGYNLTFVDNRPFEEIQEGSISKEDLWILMEYAQNYCDNEHLFEDSISCRYINDDEVVTHRIRFYLGDELADSDVCSVLPEYLMIEEHYEGLTRVVDITGKRSDLLEYFDVLNEV